MQLFLRYDYQIAEDAWLERSSEQLVQKLAEKSNKITKCLLDNYLDFLWLFWRAGVDKAHRAQNRAVFLTLDIHHDCRRSSTAIAEQLSYGFLTPDLDFIVSKLKPVTEGAGLHHQFYQNMGL